MAARTVILVATLLPLAATVTARAEEGTVGDATCLGCHASLGDDYRHTVHARVAASAEAEATSCESCHGPGAAHARSGGTDASAPGWLTFSGEDESREAREEACLQCHRGGAQRFWPASPHASRDVSCSTCHTVMKPVSDRHLLSKPSEDALCRSCHPMPAAQAKRSAHMPTRSGEGFMGCGSCHEPHGSVADKLIDAHTVNDSCTSCHAEKRGPFLWEHAPVSESCLNCHTPHGSLTPNMLRISGPRLCQSCHVQVLHVSEARRPESRFVVGRNCMSCHSQVHGSNHPSGAFLTR
ncbi:MAG: DmsE family decaheme c-type cytochrome [Myxococcales bacterium]|nr:DmsE family decaheme c-type cytochrome [Myxococcales bacterium]